MRRPVTNPAATLIEEQLNHACGGMKWDHNYQSKNVIDARGGDITILWWSFTFDVNGNVSSVTRV